MCRGAHGLPRLVRNMARAVGKEVRLVVEGEKTEVDRDILERLESPLTHLVRNAIDHGLEPPADRAAAGKPAAGTVTVDARHRAGMLLVTIADDGRGVDSHKLRKKIIDRGLNTADVVSRMTEAELLEYCRGRIASFKVPRHVFLVDEFPMTSSGKIQKVKLREEALRRLG